MTLVETFLMPSGWIIIYDLIDDPDIFNKKRQWCAPHIFNLQNMLALKAHKHMVLQYSSSISLPCIWDTTRGPCLDSTNHPPFSSLPHSQLLSPIWDQSTQKVLSQQLDDLKCTRVKLQSKLSGVNIIYTVVHVIKAGAAAHEHIQI